MFGLYNDNHAYIYIYIYNMNFGDFYFLFLWRLKTLQGHNFFEFFFKFALYLSPMKKKRLLRIESLLKIQSSAKKEYKVYSQISLIFINNKFLSNAPSNLAIFLKRGEWKRILNSPYLENNYVLGSRQNKGRL